MDKKILFMSGLLSMTVIGVLAGIEEGRPAVAQQAAVATPVAFSQLEQGVESNVKDRVNYLITSPAELAQIWKMVHASGTPPTIDFSKEAVIAVFAGEKPTTGYEIGVASVADAAERIVSVTLKQPDSGCIEGQLVTTPYELAVVPSTSLPLTHKDIVTTVTCAQ
jgi:hypothetical protein